MPPLVLSKTARKGELKVMSTEKDETKEKAETTEEAAPEEKPKTTAEAAAEENAETTAEEAAEEKPETAEKKEAKQKPASAAKADAPEKPLEKMTVKDLREMAKDMPGISGVHGMKKDELIVAIKEVKGIKEEPVKKADASVAEIKTKIKSLKAQRQAALEAKDNKMATIYRRQISRLKKKSRRKAA
jgi:protein-arginine kinase activator protein McsA